ncbi:U5 small nuclear ribonucleoprotein TSSC4 [Aplochiton taeniatus]
MSDQDGGGDGAGNTLSNRDVVTLPDNISLSDSDSEEEPNNVPFDPEVEDLSSSADDDEEDMRQGCGAPGGPSFNLTPGPKPVRGEPQSAFSLRGGSSSFSNRSRSIFDCLDSAAKLASSHLGQDNVIDGVFARPPPPPPLVVSGKKPGEVTGQLHQSSIPGVVEGEGGGRGLGRSRGGGRGRGGGVPDYLVHPERWTCYSLEDVPEMSDSRNSLVAQQYVASLQQRRQQQEDTEEPLTPNLAFNQGQSSCSSSQHKIIFSRPSKAAGKEQAPEETKAVGGREKGLGHLDQEEEIVKRAKEKAKGVSERKRKWGPSGGEDEEEKPPLQAGKPGFVSFRKINRKNFRKTSEQED